jgi:D-alanyl-D-alanine carboxypeptidase
MSANRTMKTLRITSCLLALLLLMVLACSVSLPAEAASMPSTGEPTFAKKLRPLLEAAMKQLSIPGAIIFVDDPGQGKWTTALGTRDLATNAPMQVNSYMRIGSITKTLTATVILQLVDQGKLRLDDPVGRYRPEVPNGNHITIRELLNMSSGLFNYSEDEDFDRAFLADPYKAWDPKELVAIAFKHPPYFAPGEGWRYSNTNYLLLGLLIEQITGRAVEKVFQRNIFRPLGIVDTSLPALTSSVIPNPHPRGYTRQLGTGPLDATEWNPSWAWTAGSAISRLHDLQIWAKALATGRLLSAATQKERLSWVDLGQIWIGKELDYGLGVANFGGFIGHDGELPGFQSFMGYMPQKGATIIVLVNLDVAPDGSPPADALAALIQQELFA